MRCKHCGETLANNDDATYHAGICAGADELQPGDVVRVKRAHRAMGKVGGWEWITWSGYISRVNRKTADVMIFYPRTGNYAGPERTPLDRIRKVKV